MKTKAEAGRAVEKYADTVRRICFMHLKNYSDTEDVFQDVFLKYILSGLEFASDAHEKAWLIRVAINSCKDLQKTFFRRKVVSFEDLGAEPFYMDEDERELLDAVFNLPQKYRDVIYLFYYEGYSAVEIAGMLKKSENTVYTWLDRGRKELKKQLGGEPFGK